MTLAHDSKDLLHSHVKHKELLVIVVVILAEAIHSKRHMPLKGSKYCFYCRTAATDAINTHRRQQSSQINTLKKQVKEQTCLTMEINPVNA